MPRSVVRGLGRRTALHRYLLAAVLARLADEGARVALILLAQQRTGSTTFAGLLVAALLGPQALAAPWAGALADRTRRPRALHAAGLLGFAAALASCALACGRMPAGLVLGIAVCGGCCGPLVTGGLTGLVRGLAPADRLARAYSLDAATYNLAGIAGPTSAVALAGTHGAATATLTLAASVTLAAAVILTLPLPPSTRGAGRPPPSMWPVIARGLASMWCSRPLRAVTFATTMAQVGLGALPFAVIVLTRSQHSVASAGLCLSAMAVGSLAGSLAWAHRPWLSSPPEHIVIGCLAVLALPLAAIPLVPSLPAGLVCFVLAGVCTGPLTCALFRCRDREAPADLHSQVFSLGAGCKLSAGALGAVLAGTLAGFGSGALFSFVVALTLGAAGTGAWQLRARGSA